MMVNVNTFASYYGFKNGEIDYGNKYTWELEERDDEVFGSLDNEAEVIDSAKEWFLAMACGTSQIKVTDVSMAAKIEAVLPNKRVAGLKAGSAVLKELAELKFLDPSNTAAIGRYEGMIKYISDKNGVSRAEMQDYLKQGIAAEVDKHFNTAYGDFIPAVVYDEYKRTNPVDALALIRNAITDFFLDPNRNIYAVLTGIHARYWMNGGLNRHSFGYSARESFVLPKPNLPFLRQAYKVVQSLEA
jgi:hypothetical protein